MYSSRGLKRSSNNCKHQNVKAVIAASDFSNNNYNSAHTNIYSSDGYGINNNYYNFDLHVVFSYDQYNNYHNRSNGNNFKVGNCGRNNDDNDDDVESPKLQLKLLTKQMSDLVSNKELFHFESLSSLLFFRDERSKTEIIN